MSDWAAILDRKVGEAEQSERIRTSWTPIDLTDALSGADLPPPTILARTDGRALLYDGRTHSFFGDSESCKTWLAMLGAAQVMSAGGRVLYLDFEDDERGVVSRLKALGVAGPTIAAQLDYMRPEEPLHDRYGTPTLAFVDFTEALDGSDYRLVVIDGVTEAMTTEGLELNDNTGAALYARRVAKRAASSRGRPAVVSIDHVAKGSDGTGRYAIGGQHKLAGLTGAGYKFEVRRTFRRAGIDPVHGEVVVKVVKDRPGYVRSMTSSGDRLAVVGVLELSSYPDGGVTGRLVPGGEIDSPPAAQLLAWIRDHLAVYDGDSVNKMHEARGTKDKEALTDALKWLASHGYLRVEPGPNRSKRHYLTEAGREYLAEL